MLDDSDRLVLNSTCRFGFVWNSNKQSIAKRYKAHSGLSSVDFKHKPFSQRIRLLSSRQNLAPVWAFSRSKLAVLQTILRLTSERVEEKLKCFTSVLMGRYSDIGRRNQGVI